MARRKHTVEIEKVKVEKVTTKGDQLILDAARASFDRQAHEYSDEANIKLLQYLAYADPNHWEPYAHVRVAFTLPHWVIIHKKLNANHKAGMVELIPEDNPDDRFVGHSLWGWFRLLQDHCIHFNAVNSIIDKLTGAAPFAALVLKLKSLRPNGTRHNQIRVELAPSGIPELDFVSLRVQCPIVIMRQLEKHQVGFVASEASGRYILYKKIYEPTTLHHKPENKKQGAGAELGFVRNLIARGIIKVSHAVSLASYTVLHRVLGVAIEEARYTMPMATATTRVITASRADWARVDNLRKGGDAQSDIRLLNGLIQNAL